MPVSTTLVKIKRELVKALPGLPLKVPLVHGVVERGHMTRGEFWMGDCLKAFIDSAEGVVIDIGVNVGACLVQLRVLSPDRPYVGFEPNPSCLLFTQELIRLNGFHNSRAFPLALFDSSGAARCFAGKPADKVGSLMPDFKAGDSRDYSLDVLTMVGNEVLQRIDLDHIAVIKIGVEEAELHVLRGLSGTIARHRPYLYCEVLEPDGDAERQAKSAAVFSLTRSSNYTVLGLHRDAGELCIVDDLADIDRTFKDEFVFCPDEKLQAFREAIRGNSSGVAIAF